MKELEVCTFLSRERVLDLPSIGKHQLLEQMADLMSSATAVKDIAAVKQAIFAREQSISTGIGDGIAIPHARSSAADDFVVAFARIRDGIDYDAPDGKPVRLVFMIVANEHQDRAYIKLLSRLMLRMRNTELCEQLLTASGPDELFRVLVDTR